MDYEHEPSMVEVLFCYLVPVTLLSVAVMIFIFALLVWQ